MCKGIAELICSIEMGIGNELIVSIGCYEAIERRNIWRTTREDHTYVDGDRQVQSAAATSIFTKIHPTSGSQVDEVHYRGEIVRNAPDVNFRSVSFWYCLEGVFLFSVG